MNGFLITIGISIPLLILGLAAAWVIMRWIQIVMGEESRKSLKAKHKLSLSKEREAHNKIVDKLIEEQDSITKQNITLFQTKIAEMQEEIKRVSEQRDELIAKASAEADMSNVELLESGEVKLPKKIKRKK